MILPGLSEERRRIPSPTSPKRAKLRRRGFPVPRHHLRKHTNKATTNAGISGGETRRSRVTKFNDSTVRSSSRRIDDECGSEATVKKKLVLVLDLNDNVKEEEEEREPPFDNGGSEKENKISLLKKKLVLENNVVKDDEEEEAQEPPFDDGRSENKNKSSSSKKKLVLDLNDVPSENNEEEEARESPFDNGDSENRNNCSSLKKKRVLDLNDVPADSAENKEEEEARESPFDDGGRKKKNKRSLLKRDDADNLPKLRSSSRKAQPMAKISLQLSRVEIEEDFKKMTCRRLPRKPNKRPIVVQKQLDTLFPGLMLTEVTADLYEVPEWPVQQSRKRNNRNMKGKNV